jgi:Dienelactone hydrolase family
MVHEKCIQCITSIILAIAQLAENLDWPRAKDEIVLAAKYMRQNGNKVLWCCFAWCTSDAYVQCRSPVVTLTATPYQVGATGFCQGGVLSFIAAQHAGIDCAAPFYGFPQVATRTGPACKK